MLSKITVSPAPHIGQPHSTRSIMFDVIIGLMFPVAAGAWFFRAQSLALITVSVVTCLICEWLCNFVRKKPNSLDDLSAVVTGIILALSLPPAVPYWVAIIGAAFAILIGKMVFGGLGANIFNPAMAGRAFLTACFGILMTTWTVPATIDSRMPIAGAGGADAITQATPLAWSKMAVKGKVDAKVVNRQLRAVFLGSVGGCIGETSGLALLAGGAYLLIRRTISLHIPAAVLISAAVFAAIGYIIRPQAYVSPLFHLSAGGLLLCAFFIATDPVTAPLTVKGKWIFGIGVGALVMLIRTVGEYPEGVMYSVLIMNALTPLIDRFCKLIPAGGKPDAK